MDTLLFYHDMLLVLQNDSWRMYFLFLYKGNNEEIENQAFENKNKEKERRKEETEQA